MDKPATIEFLQIDPTVRCNYTCGYCRGRHMPQDDIAPEFFTKVLDTFPGVRFIEMHGEGEPLLHPQFFEMARAVRDRGIRLSIFTNGSYFSEKNVERLLDLGLEKIVVSMDSADPETFRRIRGGVLSKVIAGLRLLMERRAARGLSSPAVGLSATFQRDTFGEVRGLVELYKTLGLDGGIGYQPVNPAPAYADHYDADLKEQIVPLSLLNQYVAGFSTSPLARQVIEGTSPHDGFYDALQRPLTQGERVCPWLDSGAYVTTGGYVTPCCMIHESAALGRVGVDPVEVLVARKEEMRQQLRTGQVPAPCRGCEIADIVTGREAVPLDAATAHRARLEGQLAAAEFDRDRAAQQASGHLQQRDELRGHMEQTAQQMAHLAAAHAAARSEVEALRHSWSWRVTSPLRRLFDLTRGIR